MFNGGEKWNEDLRSLAIAANELMKGPSKDPYGIAYSGIQNLTPQTKVLALAEREGGPYVELTMEAVRARTYPLHGEEFWYMNRSQGRPVAER